MAHAIHFLRRLERLSTPQTDLALALYRDPLLITYLLTKVRLPDGADRVALAIEDRPDGPHIVLSRDGAFITCLGEGMSVGDLPVVSRTQLDRLREEIDGLRDATAHVNEHGDLNKLFERLMTAGSSITREEFRVLAFLYPLMRRELMSTAFSITESLQQVRDTYRPRRYQRITPRTRDELRSYWQRMWALGHLTVLAGTQLREFLEQVMPRMNEQQRDDLHALSWGPSRTMSTPIVLRGAWAMARAGRLLLQSFKHHYEQAASFVQFIDSSLSLTAIGLRHRRLRAEVAKTIARRTSPILDPDTKHPEGGLALVLAQACEAHLQADENEDRTFLHHNLGTHLVVKGGANLPEDHPLRFHKPEDVPDDLAYALPLILDNELYRSPEQLTILHVLLPWLANAEAEKLYLPAEYYPAYELAWEPEITLMQLDGYRWYYGAKRPMRAEAKPGRNEPCSCGSGKKYKRCCGAE